MAVRGDWADCLGSRGCPWEGGSLPAWEETKLLPSWERFSWEGGLLGETALTAWEVALYLGRLEPACLPGKQQNCYWGECTDFLGSSAVPYLPACLPAWEELKVVSCVDTPVIFPSFLNKLLNLFTCPCLTLLNLISPTFSTKPWHF